MTNNRNVDVTNINSSVGATYRCLLNVVSSGGSILFINGGDGEYPELFADQGFKVSLITNSEDDRRIASTRQLEVIDVNKETDRTSMMIENEYDAVVVRLLGVNDEESIRMASECAPHGVVVVVAENQTHGARRVAMLAGESISKHSIRLNELKSLIVGEQLDILQIYTTVRDVIDDEIGGVAQKVPGIIIDWVRHQQNAFDDEYIVLCVNNNHHTFSRADLIESVNESLGVETSSANSAIIPLINYPKINDQYTEMGRRARNESIHAQLRDAELERLRQRESVVLQLSDELQRKDQIIRDDVKYKLQLEKNVADLARELGVTKRGMLKRDVKILFSAAIHRLGIR